MKKLVLNYLVVSAFVLLAALTSCENMHDEENKKFTVTFNSNGGSEVAAQIITEGEKATKPATDPIRDGYEFIGWFYDNDEWDFDIIITADMTFIAEWNDAENNNVDGDKTFELGPLQKILDGYVVRAIAFDSKGNAWIGTQKQGLIRYNENETVIFNSENSVLPKDFWIRDIVVDKNDNIWIGSDGLWKYDGKEFTFYNSKNTAMPEDVVWTIAVDSKNNIWFASCRFRQGGLVKYDGTAWTIYTPDNSALPDNSINDISIDQSDNVWLTVNDYLVKVSDDKWEVYDRNDMGLTNFIFAGIQFNSKNLLLGITDHSFNGYMIQPPCELYSFDGKKSTLLSKIDNATSIPGQTKIVVDHNDYVWCYSFGSSNVCAVWAGNQWTQLGFNAWVIKENPDHRIWIGTINGIYIR